MCEAKMLSELKSKSFPQFYSYGEANGCPYLAMELLEPGELPSGDRNVARFLLSVCDAVAELHSRGYIHRDIKPGNIIFVHGKAVLADVGLAIDARDAASIVGTPGYAPPERQGSPAGDVFGLGKTLYRISTGRQPSEEGLPPCTEADIDAPFFWKWMTILAKATARDPAQRYRSAKGFLRDLRRLRFLASPAKRSVRRALMVIGVIVFITVILPALWHQPVFYAWLSMPPNCGKEHMILPFPYSLVKPLFLRHLNSPQPPDP